jgi:microsomal dipeptidase-like Zn-dependent dipeptidase
MHSFTRKRFLHQLLLAVAGVAFVPRWVRGQGYTGPLPSFQSAGPAFVPNDFGIVDLHCHPSLKMYLWGRKLWRHHTTGLGINVADMEDDAEEMSIGEIPGQRGKGFVKGIVVAHYLPEAAVKEQWDTLRMWYPWIARLFKNFADKVEHGDWSNIEQIKEMITLMEDQAKITAGRKGAPQFVVAKNFKEFNDAIAAHQFPIAHAIEGAHALGRDPLLPAVTGTPRKTKKWPVSQARPGAESRYITNLKELKDKGVCMITLAHLFPNDIASCVEGISPDEKKGIGMHWMYDPDRDNKPLTAAGVEVVNWMLENGMIVDLTHSTPAARDQVFQINSRRRIPRPLVFTHTGAQKVFTDHSVPAYKNYRYYCVSEEEIARIVACDGTIGILPEVFWLAGGDTHLRHEGLPPKLFRNGIPYMIETIRQINSLTPDKDYRHLSIGTDFDGLADMPQDLYEASQLDALIEALREAIRADLKTAGKDPDDTDEYVKRIMSKNALRVLEFGWV